MIRVLHTGDLHVPDGARHDDTVRCLNALIDDGIAQGVQLFLVAGDLGGTTVPYRHTPLVRNALADAFQRMAGHCPTLILRGNHDVADDIAIYGRLTAAHPIVVVNDPEVVELAGARIFCFPYPEKRHWRQFGLSIEETDQVIANDLQALLLTWQHLAAEARTARVPTVFLGHVSIGGALLAGGERQLPPGHEIELSVQQIEAVGADYAGCSHIHLAQAFAGGRIWYPGSPSRSNFGEEEDAKGWSIVDVEPGRAPLVHRRESPARVFRTFEATWAETNGVWGWDLPVLDAPQRAELAGAEVRVRTIIPEEAVGSSDMLSLERWFRDAQVYAFHVERRIVPKQDLRCPEIVETESLVEQLKLVWLSQGADAPDAAQQARVLALLEVLEAEEAAA